MNKEKLLNTAIPAGLILITTIFTAFLIIPAKNIEKQVKVSGSSIMIIGTDSYNLNKNIPIQADLEIKTIDTASKIDKVYLHSTFFLGKNEYTITIDKPMRNHPFDLYETSNGVAYNENDIALFGWADVSLNGKIIEKMIPAKAIVSKTKGISLEISTEEKSMTNIPNGYLHLIWPQNGSGLEIIEVP